MGQQRCRHHRAGHNHGDSRALVPALIPKTGKGAGQTGNVPDMLLSRVLPRHDHIHRSACPRGYCSSNTGAYRRWSDDMDKRRKIFRILRVLRQNRNGQKYSHRHMAAQSGKCEADHGTDTGEGNCGMDKEAEGVRISEVTGKPVRRYNRNFGRYIDINTPKSAISVLEKQEEHDREVWKRLGYPEKLDPKKMYDPGVLKLMAAIIKDSVQVIVRYYALVYNNMREYSISGCLRKKNGEEIPDKLFKVLDNECKHEVAWLHGQYASFFLMGLPPDAVIREAKKTAQKTVEDNYRSLRRGFIEDIRKYGITQQDLMNELALDEEELAEWFHRMYYKRSQRMTKAIKEIRKRKKNETNKEGD